MHKSRLAGFIIDCKTDDLEAAGRFWGEALGLKVRRSDDAEDNGYVTYAREPNGLNIEVQKVSHDSRVHLDIETDDVEAEAARLQKLGAKVVSRVKSWIVMEAPTGHRFCLVRASRSRFEDEANVWA